MSCSLKEFLLLFFIATLSKFDWIWVDIRDFFETLLVRMIWWKRDSLTLGAEMELLDLGGRRWKQLIMKLVRFVEVENGVWTTIIRMLRARVRSLFKCVRSISRVLRTRRCELESRLACGRGFWTLIVAQESALRIDLGRLLLCACSEVVWSCSLLLAAVVEERVFGSCLVWARVWSGLGVWLSWHVLLACWCCLRRCLSICALIVRQHISGDSAAKRFDYCLR